jgi:Sulfotransferase domain
VLVGDPLPQATNYHSGNADAASSKPLLAFVHIPRTGGGTLSSAISKNYSPQRSVGNYQRSAEKARQRLEAVENNPGLWEAVGDHVPYGLYLRYLPPETRYITVLRDPVDRVLSHYHFHAQSGNPPGSSGTRKLMNVWETLLNSARLELDDEERPDEITLDPADDYSLEEGLRRKIVIYDNFMTRFLWGGETIFGELPPDALERAKENLSTFWFIGIRERLDDSIVVLGRKLGVGLMPYNLRHVSQKRPPLDQTSDELRALVAEHNALDVELFRFARERFEQESPATSELAEEVQELRTRSEEVTEAAEKARQAKMEANRARERAEKTERAAENRSTRIEQRGGTKEEKRAARGSTKVERRASRDGTKALRRAGGGNNLPETGSGDQATAPDKQPSTNGESTRRTRRVQPKTKGAARRRDSTPAAEGSAPAGKEVPAGD